MNRSSSLHPEQDNIYTVYYSQRESGWSIKDRYGRGYTSISNGAYEYKKDAVKRARKLAKGDRPSVLVVKKADDSLSKETRYD